MRYMGSLKSGHSGSKSFNTIEKFFNYLSQDQQFHQKAQPFLKKNLVELSSRDFFRLKEKNLL